METRRKSRIITRLFFMLGTFTILFAGAGGQSAKIAAHLSFSSALLFGLGLLFEVSMSGRDLSSLGATLRPRRLWLAVLGGFASALAIYLTLRLLSQASLAMMTAVLTKLDPLAAASILLLTVPGYFLFFPRNLARRWGAANAALLLGIVVSVAFSSLALGTVTCVSCFVDARLLRISDTKEQGFGDLIVMLLLRTALLCFIFLWGAATP